MVIEEDEGIMNEAIQLLSHVQQFILVNHLYWGLWAVNQAAEEGCEEFDYLTYASNRFNEYYVKKSEWEEK
jgi:ethanolamine kinase